MSRFSPTPPTGLPGKAGDSAAAVSTDAAFSQLRATLAVFSRALARGDLEVLEHQVPQLQAAHRACVAAVAQAATRADDTDLSRMRLSLQDLQRELALQRGRVAQQASMNRQLLELVLPDMANPAAYTDRVAAAAGATGNRGSGVARLYSAAAR